MTDLKTLQLLVFKNNGTSIRAPGTSSCPIFTKTALTRALSSAQKYKLHSIFFLLLSVEKLLHLVPKAYQNKLGLTSYSN